MGNNYDRVSAGSAICRGKPEGYKQNDFEKYVNLFCVQNDLSHKKLSVLLDCRGDELSTLIRLKSSDILLFNKVLRFLEVPEDLEEKFSALFDKAEKLNAKICLNNYPYAVANIVSKLLKKHTTISPVILTKIEKLLINE